ncbi:AbrB/MazE/SpoVT family DNA-binding domain-containing protein [Novosphingobium soli]|uniref:AbrB/MazE/SpoVT family DNA-binding domain-containing protein n=1 Tax=Novosphingobium soli TaxID=574956 RepID=A0ABV6CXI0_9SPHN
MNAHAKVETGMMTSEGQVLIPKAMREACGLLPGQPYSVALDAEGRIVISAATLSPEDVARRKRQIDEALHAVSGKYPFGKSTDEIMRELRGDDWP